MLAMRRFPSLPVGESIQPVSPGCRFHQPYQFILFRLTRSGGFPIRNLLFNLPVGSFTKGQASLFLPPGPVGPINGR